MEFFEMMDLCEWWQGLGGIFYEKFRENSERIQGELDMGWVPGGWFWGSAQILKRVQRKLTMYREDSNGEHRMIRKI